MPAVFVGRLGPLCASFSLSGSDIHQVCLSLSLTAGLQRVPFQIRPLLRLARLQIKGPRSEGGFLATQTSAGKRPRRTNERFC